jgi:DNA polymerase alpha subunit A
MIDDVMTDYLEKYDPDMIIGHNFIGFDLDVLLHRMSATNNPHWSRLGRLKRTHMPKLQSGAGGMGESTFQEKLITAGRLICDTYLVSKVIFPAFSQNLRGISPEISSEKYRTWCVRKTTD